MRPFQRPTSILALIGAVVAVLATPLGSLETNAAGTVSGRVYQDFLSNGVFNTAVAAGRAADVGVGGITVNAFDSTGARVGATTSSSDGTYVLSVTGSRATICGTNFQFPQRGPFPRFKARSLARITVRQFNSFQLVRQTSTMA